MREDDKEIANFIEYISRTTGLILTEFDTKHPWIKEIPVSSNERSQPFPKEVISKIWKIH